MHEPLLSLGQGHFDPAHPPCGILNLWRGGALHLLSNWPCATISGTSWALGKLFLVPIWRWPPSLYSQESRQGPQPQTLPMLLMAPQRPTGLSDFLSAWVWDPLFTQPPLDTLGKQVACLLKSLAIHLSTQPSKPYLGFWSFAFLNLPTTNSGDEPHCEV